MQQKSCTNHGEDIGTSDQSEPCEPKIRSMSQAQPYTLTSTGWRRTRDRLQERGLYRRTKLQPMSETQAEL